MCTYIKIERERETTREIEIQNSITAFHVQLSQVQMELAIPFERWNPATPTLSWLLFVQLRLPPSWEIHTANELPIKMAMVQKKSCQKDHESGHL